MTYSVSLSVASVTAILIGVAVLATLATLTLERVSGQDRVHTALLFVSLGAIWATAVLVMVLIKLTL